MRKLIRFFAAVTLLALTGAVSAQVVTRAYGNITTQNLVAAGACTAGGCVEIDVTNKGSVGIQVTGTYTGALSAQVTTNGTTWTTLAPTPFTPSTATGTPTATIGSGSTGQWQVAAMVPGSLKLRVTALAAVTGTAVLTLNSSPVAPAGSGGGGGAGDASAANQATQITAEQATQASVASLDTKATTAQTSRANIESYTSRLLSSAGPATPGAAAATTSFIVGARHNTTPATRTNGQEGSLEVDAAGNLRTAELDTLVINGSVTSAATLFSQDLTGYQGIIVQITSAGSASTITYEASEDNTTWYAYPGFDVTNATTAASSTTTAVGLRAWTRKSRYFRARVSTYGSGTVTVVASLTKAPVLTYLHAFIANSNLGITGQSAHDAAVSLAPVRIGARARTAQYATTIVNDDVTDVMADLSGAIITKPYSPSGTDWNYTAAASGIVNTTTAVTIKAAAAAGYRNYVQRCDVATDTLGGATELVIRDGAAGTVIYRTKLQTGPLNPTPITFTIPRRSTAATLLEAATLTAVTGGVYLNCEGYEAQ